MPIASRIITLAAVGILIASVAGVATAQNYSATLDGLQEVPPNASPGTGTATLVLNGAGMLSVHVDFSGLTAAVTAAHIHAPAPPGANAAVRFPLIPPGPPSSPIDQVVGPLTAAQIADLNNGLNYVNIHTQNFPGGEIRGQVVLTVAVEPGTWGRIKTLFN